MFKFEKDDIHDILELSYEEPHKRYKTLLDLIEIPQLTLELGSDLIPLADPAQGGELLTRLFDMRVRFILDLGFIAPGIIIRDNSNQSANEYSIEIKGNEVARGEILMGYMLAIQQSQLESHQKLEGPAVKDSVTGNDAFWITSDDISKAEDCGYIVMDPLDVLLRNFTETVKNYSYELLSRNSVELMINKIKEKQPSVVNELIPELMNVRELQKVLQNLLREKISIRNMVTIMETLTDWSRTTKDANILSEFCRQSLSKQICAGLINEENVITVISLDPKLEEIIRKSLRETAQGTFIALNPKISQQLLIKLAAEMRNVVITGDKPVILCNPDIRPHVRRLTERHYPNLDVISFNEIAPNIKIEASGNISIDLDEV